MDINNNKLLKVNIWKYLVFYDKNMIFSKIDSSIKFLNNELKSKIIKSDDNKFEFDISKNFFINSW
jgi:hypothetical protein